MRMSVARITPPATTASGPMSSRASWRSFKSGIEQTSEEIGHKADQGCCEWDRQYPYKLGIDGHFFTSPINSPNVTSPIRIMSSKEISASPAVMVYTTAAGCPLVST